MADVTITTAGLAALAAAMTDPSAPVLTYCELGSDDTAATAADTSITPLAPVRRFRIGTPQGRLTVDGSQIILRFIDGSRGATNTYDAHEIGVFGGGEFDGDGALTTAGDLWMRVAEMNIVQKTANSAVVFLVAINVGAAAADLAISNLSIEPVASKTTVGVMQFANDNEASSGSPPDDKPMTAAQVHAQIASTPVDTEEVQDVIGSTVRGGTNISVTYNDTDGQVTINAESDEALQDLVGAMFSGNTETNIAATYQDADGTIDLVVDNRLRRITYGTGDPPATGAAGTIYIQHEA